MMVHYQQRIAFGMARSSRGSGGGGGGSNGGSSNGSKPCCFVQRCLFEMPPTPHLAVHVTTYFCCNLS